MSLALYVGTVKRKNIGFDIRQAHIGRGTHDENTTEHWEDFANMYRTELEGSDAVRQFMERIKTYDTVTLLYASKDPIRNHARILQQFLSAHMA